MNWQLALPEIVLAACGMAILIFGVLWRGRDSSFACSMLTIGAFLLAALLVHSRATGLGYNGLFIIDPFSAFLKLLILAGAVLSLVLSVDWNEREGIQRFEFPVLMLFSVTGMMVMASASNLMTLYMGLELQSLALYVLAAFARDDARSSEAGLKYFVLSALASGLLLYGISLCYGFSGTMNFAQLATAAANPAGVSPGLIVGIVFVLVGLASRSRPCRSTCGRRTSMRARRRRSRCSSPPRRRSRRSGCCCGSWSARSGICCRNSRA